ncbi:hypothetical protein ACTWP5_28525 [Streptomyces sp. 4N509B]|uniref:hypothetical protein n=1 Tax=Streptomyces sp. 4N509B TaxID=3457413 RepID=UPI003FD2BAE9
MTKQPVAPAPARRWTARRLAVIAVTVLLVGTWTTVTTLWDVWGSLGRSITMLLLAYAIPVILLAVFAGDVDGRSDFLDAWREGTNGERFRRAPVGVGRVTSGTPRRVSEWSSEERSVYAVDLEVTGAHGERFRSEMRFVSHEYGTERMRPLPFPEPRAGLLLPVRYLPDEPARVEFDRSSTDHLAGQAALDRLMLNDAVVTDRKLDVARRGIATHAVVRALAATGQIAEGMPQLELELAVSRPDGLVFSQRLTRYVPDQSLGWLQVGRVLRVRYLPEFEDTMLLELPDVPGLL